MGSKKAARKGGTAVQHRVEDTAQRLGDALPARARKANKKVTKSMRKHPAGWGAAVAGVTATAVGAVVGLAARRRARS